MDTINTMLLAHAIETLSVVGEDGEVTFGPLEMYQRIVGGTTDEVDNAFDDALSILEDEGTYRRDGNRWYHVDTDEECRRMRELDEAEAKQQRLDEAQAYDFNIWG